MSSGAGLDCEFVEVLGERITSRDAGAGEKTLLLVHGKPESGHVFAPLVERLSDRFRCVAPDLRWFGGSDEPPDAVAAAIGEFVEAL